MTTWHKPPASRWIYFLIFCFPTFLYLASSQTGTSNVDLQNNSLASLPVNENDQDSTSGSSRRQPRRRRPRDTSLEPRICNSVEVAAFDGENYSCTCRPGYFFQNQTCVPPAILFTSGSTVFKLIQHPNSTTTTLPCAQSETDRNFCNAVEERVLKPGEQPSKVRLQFDPYSLGYLLEDPETKCMSYCNLKDGNTTTLFCLPQDQRLHSSAMDFKVGTLFWIQTKNCDELSTPCKLFRLHSRRISTGRSPPKPFVPYGGFLSSLTIDPEHNSLFWVNKPTDATKLIHTHYKNDEVSGEEGIFSVRPHAILHAYNSHVLWIYPGDPNITYLDIINQTSKQTLKVDQPLQDFYILPPPQTINPCEEATCTHTCIPHHDLGLNLKYLCACPDGMILAPDNSCRPIQFLIMRPPNEAGQTLYQTWETSGLVQTIAEFPLSTSAALNLIAFNFNTRTICRHDNASQTTECVSGGKRFQVLEVDEGTSMLLMDDSRNEIFWNNGKAGCISFKSLTRDGRVTFPCFETPEIRAEALDTRRKIFFWANTNRTICMKILYQKSSSPSCQNGTKTLVSSIALDIGSKNLYYTRLSSTSQLGLIYRLPYSSFTGGGQQPLEIIPNQPLAVTSIKYHENYLMFTQPASVSVMSLSNLKVISLNSSSPDAVSLPEGATIIYIFGPTYRRNEARDPCKTSHCSDFCFPSIAAPDIICGCSDGSQLGDDHATCDFGKLSTGWIVGITMLIFSVVAALVIGVTVVIMRRNRDAYIQRAKADFLKGDQRRARMATNPADAALYLPLPVSYILQPSDVTVDYDNVLGEGQYGLVVKGKYKRNEVAIKTFKSFDLNIVVEFTKEIKIMAFIGDHPHVVHFHGTVVGRGFFYAVLELSTFGSLKDYLTETLKPPTTECRLNSTLDMSVITKLVTWSEHIARGMEHLALKRVIHGDLATRNVLLFPGYVAKVIDFGLARNYDPSYAGYQKRNLSPLPWKWMDYDALKFLKFSSASDVWAFGVTMWEIFTFGEMPFPQYNWDDDFTNALEQGLRLPKPKHAPDEIYNQIIMPCWELHRADRPTFAEIIRQLEDYSTLIQCTQEPEQVVHFQNGRMEHFE